VCAYSSLWIDLLLSLIASKYEKYYASLGAKERKNNRSSKSNQNTNQKVKNG
jgi:hypothetical protein